MSKQLDASEMEKLEEFRKVYSEYVNLKKDNSIEIVVNYIFDYIKKVYLEYKKVIPFINISNVPYPFYMIKPINNQYHLLDYLINIAIDRIDSIEIVNNTKLANAYNYINKKLTINKNSFYQFSEMLFHQIKDKVSKEDFKVLYEKNIIYHEIGHALHYNCINAKENTIYVPLKWISENNSNSKQQTMKRLEDKISLFSRLKPKYNLLSINDLVGCNVESEFYSPKPWAVFIPPILFDDSIDEAFTECDAQIYSGMLENKIFDDGIHLSCFYLPIDDTHITMTYSPSEYSFSANIAATIKKGITKQTYFKTIFLGNNDMFKEIGIDIGEFSSQLRSSQYSNSNMEEVQKLLNIIEELYRKNSIPMNILDIYFPLVNINREWVYYTASCSKKVKK